MITSARLTRLAALLHGREDETYQIAERLAHEFPASSDAFAALIAEHEDALVAASLLADPHFAALERACGRG